MIHDPNHMTEEEVADKWDEFADVDRDLSNRMGLREGDMDSLSKDEMIDVEMVFFGKVPVIRPKADSQWL